MDEMEKRLVTCFSAVLPELTPEEVSKASAATVPTWDSVATVTLLAVVEEEFGISVSDEDPGRFDSFQNILSYLQETAR